MRNADPAPFRDLFRICDRFRLLNKRRTAKCLWHWHQTKNFEHTPRPGYCLLGSFLLHSGHPITKGDVAKWLGTALQKRLRRFEPARHLQIPVIEIGFFEFFLPKPS